MKSRLMLGLVLVSSLVCGTVATADFQGLDYRVVATNAVAGDFNWTVEIYVVLDPAERLDAVAGDGAQDKRLATSGAFFQHPGGGPTSMSINPTYYKMFPELEYDSWVTIGAMDQTGTPYGANALQTIGIDWTNFEDNGGDLYTDNGLWFVTPDDTQGEPTLFTNQNCVDKYGVLVARVTTFDQNAVVFMGALFQGKDAGGATWQQTADINIAYPVITDCNSNGVDDGCDIINGTSLDDNGNGIPDECEFADCNNNGVEDDQDIANGTSQDCNSNGTPDECEMATGDCNDNGILDDCENFTDCNDNDIPDECETFNDCNDNGVPDECEDLTDWDGNGVADICEDLVAWNVTAETGYTHIDDANMEASDGDVIWVQADHVNAVTSVAHNDGVDNDCNGSVDNPGLEISLYDGSRFNVDGDALIGSVRSGTSGTASVNADGSVSVDFAMAYRDASLDFSGTTVNVGDALLRRDSEMGIDGDAHATGTWTVSDGSVVYADLTIDGELRGTTDLMGDTTVNGEMRATDDILVGSNLTNNGLIAMHRGVLYVFGDLTNNGTILGEVDGGPGVRGGTEPAPGDGMKVVGNYTAGENASILMPHPNWKISVGGNFDVSINDSAMFVMNQATLKFNGHDGEQLVEVMSGDYGSTEDALNPAFGCTFPIGTVNVASGAHVVLVDNRNNDCDNMFSEVIYTENLHVAAGATLDTNGYIIYASEVDNQGVIIGEDDIIIINPPLPGDANGDGFVGILDVLVVIADWGPCDGCAGDVNEDGVASILDVLFIIANWS